MAVTSMTAEPDADEALIARIKAGEVQLFESLMRRHNRRVYRVARSFTKTDAEAEDVMQEAYIHAFMQLHRFEGRARFSSWLTRIAINEALGRRRRDKPFAEAELEKLMDGARGPEESAYSAEVVALLERAVAELPEIFRLVFVLRAVEQLSVREVAECLDITEETVKTRYFRARAQLKDALAEQAESLAPSLYDFHLDRCDRVVAGVLGRLTS